MYLEAVIDVFHAAFGDYRLSQRQVSTSTGLTHTHTHTHTHQPFLQLILRGAWWLSGRALDLRFTGRGFNSRPVAFT